MDCASFDNITCADFGDAPAPQFEECGSDEFLDATAEAELQQDLLAPLPDEPWSSHPERERKMWERVRTPELRRQASLLRALRLPAAAVTRLARLHPDSDGLRRSPEALELINCTAILLTQAVARAAARRRPDLTILASDVREVCADTRELRFLHPLSTTLDASARSVQAPTLAPPVSSVVGSVIATEDDPGNPKCVEVKSSDGGSNLKRKGAAEPSRARKAQKSGTSKQISAPPNGAKSIASFFKPVGAGA